MLLNCVGMYCLVVLSLVSCLVGIMTSGMKFDEVNPVYGVTARATDSLRKYPRGVSMLRFVDMSFPPVG